MAENNNRMTWEEIIEKYPDTWVGLVEIEWKDQANVKTAIVKYTDKTKSELLEMQFTGKEPDMYSRYTTPDHVFQLGMMG